MPTVQIRAPTIKKEVAFANLFFGRDRRMTSFTGAHRPLRPTGVLKARLSLGVEPSPDGSNPSPDNKKRGRFRRPLYWSGQADSNRRHLAPKASALPG